MVIMTMRMRLTKSLMNLENKTSFNRITAVELLDSTNVQQLSQSENGESDYDDKIVEVEKKVLVPGELKCKFVILGFRRPPGALAQHFAHTKAQMLGKYEAGNPLPNSRPADFVRNFVTNQKTAFFVSANNCS